MWTAAVKPCPILGKSITNQSVLLAQICDQIIAMGEITVCELCTFVCHLAFHYFFRDYFYLLFFSLWSISDSFPTELPELACQLLLLWRESVISQYPKSHDDGWRFFSFSAGHWVSSWSDVARREDCRKPW